MTAAELASFRALLQTQAPPPRPDRALFARMRARLTVVERVGPLADAPPRLRRSGAPAVSRWSPTGLAPASRQRLRRLEAMIDAERCGLDARIAAEAPTG